MRTKPVLVLTLATVFGFGPFLESVLAQPDKPQREGQRDERSERKRQTRRGRDRVRYKTPGERMKLLESKIDLDENQRTQIEEILRVGHESTQRMRDEMRPTEEELEEIKALRQQMRDARESGDSEAMDAARAAQRAFTQRRKARMDEFRTRTLAEEAKMRDEIQTHLREDQLKAFDTAWAEITEYSDRFGRRDRDARNARGMDARRMRRIVDGLEGLTPTQKKQIDQLFDEHREKQRKARRDKRDRERDRDAEGEPKGDRKPAPKRGKKGRDANTEVDALADAVIAVLNEEQAAEFQAQLDKAKAKRDRRAGDKRRKKDGRDRDRRPPPPPGERDE